MSATIFHNPACGTSRNALGLIRNAGIEPTVVEYLKTPPSRAELRDLVARAGLAVREAVGRRARPMRNLASTTPVSPTISFSMP